MFTEKPALVERRAPSVQTQLERLTRRAVLPHGRWRGCCSDPGPQLGSGSWHCNTTLASDSSLACPRCAVRAPPAHSSELPQPRNIGGTVIALFKPEARMLPALMQRSCWILPILSSESSSISQTALLSRRSTSGLWQLAFGWTHAWAALQPDPFRRELHSSRELSRLSEVLEDKTNTHLSRSGVSSLVIYLNSPQALAMIIMHFCFS